MSFRSVIEEKGTLRRSISLATHLGTPIENETYDSEVCFKNLGRAAQEQRFGELYPQVLKPVAGYNCFGQIFACRRTSLYEVDIDLLLCEDGFDEINSSAEYRVGDVVVYFDDGGVTHVARISSFSKLIVDGVALAAFVVSKFDDCSGEYEHGIEDVRWDTVKNGTITFKVYRERWKPPCRKPGTGWRTRVL